MAQYILLMHDDSPNEVGGEAAWGDYLARLRALGCFEGGSAIGAGACVRKCGDVPPVTATLSGFIRITADGLEDACVLVAGNPVYEAGGTVEIRELPRTG